MEQLNSKLLTNYQNLKKRKGYTADELNDNADAYFRRFCAETNSMIEELENENHQLRAEIASMQDKYERELLDERQKSDDLSSEIRRLKSMLAERSERHIFPSERHIFPLDSSISPAIRSGSLSQDSLRRNSLKLITIQKDEQQTDPTISSAKCIEEQIVPDCCRRTFGYSGGEQLCCVLQKIMEFLVGMKFSVNNQDEGLSLLFIHPKTGYTFNITQKKDEVGDEDEFVYQVCSLGTLENVTLEWMKEDILFSMSMLPIFFERINKIIRLHS